jgi:hypothetical protein
VARHDRVFRHGGTVATKDDKEGDASDGSIPLVYTSRLH